MLLSCWLENKLVYEAFNWMQYGTNHIKMMISLALYTSTITLCLLYTVHIIRACNKTEKLQTATTKKQLNHREAGTQKSKSQDFDL